MRDKLADLELGKIRYTTLTLTDGKELNGVVKSFDSQTVVFSSNTSGEIQVPFADIIDVCPRGLGLRWVE